MIMIGGTGYGDVYPQFHLVNGLIAGAFVLAYIVNLRRADRIDTAVLVALLAFTAAALLSSFPRQSFDAVLAALAYAAALFVARDLLGRDVVRRLFPLILMAVSLLVTLSTAVRWLPPIVEWWSLTDWTIAPPLAQAISGAPWGHQHDLALLIAMVYPAWWLGKPSSLRRVLAVLVGILALVIVIIDGSRTVWLALAVAIGIVATPYIVRRWPRRRQARWTLSGLVLAGLTLVLVSGLAATVVDRLTSLASLEPRIAMWGSLIEAWLGHPIAGLGPGSFAWILQTTAYFDTNSWTPRHPDSVLFQVLPEAGILGLSAVLILGAALIPAIMRGRSVGAWWALIVFAAVGFGANPTDFVFFVVLAIAWTAYAVPRAPTPRVDALRPTRGWPRIASIAALGILGTAYICTVGAGLAYFGAQAAVRRGDLPEAEAGLTTAITLDPGMALYWRQRATARLLSHATAAGIDDLQRAVTLNPSDDLAWRTLALAHASRGDETSAVTAANQALDVQRSDVSNLLVATRLAIDDGRRSDALRLLGEVVHGWPQIVAAPAWDTLVADGDITTADVISEAATRLDKQLPAPQSNHPLLGVLTERPAAPTGGVDIVARAALASYRCEPGVLELLAMASDAERRRPEYWGLVIRESIGHGAIDERASRLYEIMTGTAHDPSAELGTLDPLGQHDVPASYGSDIWGYRRAPIGWPAYEVQLPSPNAGARRWLFDPIGAGQSAGLRGCFAHSSARYWYP